MTCTWLVGFFSASFLKLNGSAILSAGLLDGEGLSAGRIVVGFDGHHIHAAVRGRPGGALDLGPGIQVSETNELK